MTEPETGPDEIAVQSDSPDDDASAGQASTLLVNEVFCSIQGEGTRSGRPCLFIRLTGCPLRCVWCDTTYAFGEGQRRTLEDLVEGAAGFPTRLVCLTGGEPLAQPLAFDLVTRLADADFEVVVETSGHILLHGLDSRAFVVMDVKVPGSGESARMEWRNLELLRPKDEIKFVLADRRDYEWARDFIRGRGLTSGRIVLFSPVHGRLPPANLAHWILEDGLSVRLQLQLHKFIWPGVERGV